MKKIGILVSTIILGIFLIGLMTVSLFSIDIFGSNSSSQQNTVKYNNFEFTLTQNGWITTVNNQQLAFTHTPNEVEQIDIDNVQRSNFDFIQKIYLSRTGLVPREILQLPLNIQAIRATYDENVSIQEDIPLKTCDDATETTLVIMFIPSNETKVRLKNNCLVIEDTQNFVMPVNKLIMRLWGIL